MISVKIASSFLIGSIFALSACDSGEEIPKKSDKEGFEEINNINIESVERNAKSIKEAAAEAVKIIEKDAQTEIDTIKIDIVEPTEEGEATIEEE